jgi:lipopolysaccharide export system protein LptC
MSAAIPLGYRLRQALTGYLPLVLMLLLALSTWWLVKNTPIAPGAREAVPARHEPDYTMDRFTVLRFSPDGRLRVRIEGDRLRHFPDTDTVEIDTVRVRALSLDGRETLATARRALANGSGTEVQLLGGAHVISEGAPGEAPIDFRGEFLHAFFETERLRSHLPVEVTQGGATMRADGMEYDNLSRVVQLKGGVRASFPPAAGRAPSR